MFELFHYLLMLIVPGFVGALAYSIADRFSTEIRVGNALILNLLTYVIMITGLYFFQDIYTTADLTFHFTCLSFSRNYALLSILIAVVLGVVLGLLRRILLWFRKS